MHGCQIASTSRPKKSNESMITRVSVKQSATCAKKEVTMSEYRRKCLEQKGDECLICEDESKAVVVHHIDGDDSNDSLENLMPVCRPCHMSIHAGADGYEKWTAKVPDSAMGAYKGTGSRTTDKLDLGGGEIWMEFEKGPMSFEKTLELDSIEWVEKDGKEIFKLVGEIP